LVIGGARSGKSRYALGLAAQFLHKAFIATAEPMDDEMRDRIRRHREERGDAYRSLEEPVDLAGALLRLPAGTEIVIIDCLTVWLGNLVHRRGEGSCAELGEYPEIGELLSALATAPCPLILVSNEVGLGIVPANALARSFVDLAGRLNQEVAARADRVILMVSGLPLQIRGGPA
jgi:adenosylcobinamide kinase/adenosylcobinamide-phosphate guanylyltransferase